MRFENAEDKHACFLGLFTAHESSIHAYVRRLVYRREDASDVMQKIAIILWKKFDQLKILGRVYIAKEGINAQISVPVYNWNVFKQKLEKIKELKDISLKKALHKFSVEGMIPSRKGTSRLRFL